MENTDAPRAQIIVSLNGDRSFVETRGYVSRSSRKAELPEQEAQESPYVTTLYDSKDLEKLRHRSFWCVQVAMFAGLVFIATGIAAVLFSPDLTKGIVAGFASGVGSATAFYLRATHMKVFNGILNHIIAQGKLNNDIAHRAAFWKTWNKAVDSGDPATVRTLFELFPHAKGKGK
ncbi:hypothetical protein J8N05_32290 [Streptomyces sp. BH-SS-21]|uniref:Cyanobacterial TRADD-N associated 2 transmembrane domain-containing protein n=1 Tax=Streptomyces liliiviolaceus TaxID=2823109 RepID=A0A941BAK6_9ACTN|nr:hypothetical protein [Streptomyces liliiviolaceus]MBQ0852852.1 hypothetical protein [Streptomyces liliiviolaceus]